MAKKHWFEDTIRIAGIFAAVFSFVLVLTGCDGMVTGSAESYTFRFKVQNNSEKTITGIEFRNGTNKSAFVLRRIYSPNLGTGELSDEYRVPGFTKEHGTDERYYAVLVTYEDDTEVFNYSFAGPESKILVTSKDVNNLWIDKQEIVFSSGW
ncbi:MAG: hypothetical protein LBH57_05870 [Treponema sp.]|nr:hypothetical protein [Treponema sp.]